MSADVWRTPSSSPYSFNQKIRMALWWITEAILFRPSPHKMNSWRCFLLRLYGAKIGKNTFIHPSSKIWFPWNFEIGSNSGIGFEALIYNLDLVEIGDMCAIAQRVHINTGSHDFELPNFPLLTKPVRICAGAFVGTDSYVGLGVTIGEMAVIGARSVVTKNMPANYVCVGHPCKPMRRYERRDAKSEVSFGE